MTIKRTKRCAGDYDLEHGEHHFRGRIMARIPGQLGPVWALTTLIPYRGDVTLCVADSLRSCLELAESFAAALDSGWDLEESACRMMGVIYRIIYLIQARGPRDSSRIVPDQYGGWHLHPRARWFASLDGAIAAADTARKR